MRTHGDVATDRALTPVIGVVLLLGLTVVIAGVAAGGLLAVEGPDPPPTTVLDVAADADSDTITVRHARGDALEPSKLSVRIAVEGTELEEQPPVPFFSADGFAPGPTGPFNSGTDDDWTAGETGSLRIASTNTPGGLAAGESVSVTIVYDEHVLAEKTVTAR